MTNVQPNQQNTSLRKGFARLLALTAGVLAVLAPGADAASLLTSEEQALANLMVNASGQRRNRAAMKPDARLVSVARARARDMAERDYFSHVNPDGNGPNHLVKKAGYPLAEFYTSSRSLNYIESIAGGTASAQSTWASLMDSSGHRKHLLAEDSFYREQTTYGIGHYYSSGSRYKHYWVIITAPPAGPDGLAVSSPAQGARVTKDSVTVSGTSAGTDFVSAIQVRVENGAGTGAWKNMTVPSGPGGSWSGTIGGLIPGQNTVRVRTLDGSGAPKQEVARTIRYAVVKPLVVSVSGPGDVTEGFEGTSNRELGAPLTIKAQPLPGAIFDHWEGLPDSPGRDPLARVQTLVMQEGLVLLAVFVPSPFTALKGSYAGLTGGDSAGADSAGLLKLKLTGSGVFTGTLKRGGAVLAFKGRFNSRGDATVNIAVPGAQAIALSLHMDPGGGSEQIAVTLGEGDGAQTLTLSRAVAPDSTDAYSAGRLTVRISPDETQPLAPQGHGYATVKVTDSGTARVQGATADGRPFSGSGLVGSDGAFSMYVPLRGGEGAITATLQLAADGEADGSLRWLNPERPGAARYHAAFASTHVLAGGAYTAPAPGEPCVKLSPEANVGEITLEGGDIEEPLQQLVKVDGFNRVAPAGPVAQGLKLRVNPLNGRVSGSYLHPMAGTRPITGVIIQGENGAWGHFLGATEAGNAALLPAGN